MRSEKDSAAYLSFCRRVAQPPVNQTHLEWLAQKDWDAYLVLQKHIWRARMERVLDEIRCEFFHPTASSAL